jgi:pimeloyl-ACP methyl ester carboxylesterase
MFSLTMILTIAISLTAVSKSAAHIKILPPQRTSIPDTSTPKTESMIDVGGRKIHCCVYGKNGPTVVLASGFGAPQTYWNTVVPDLAAQTTVVTFDRAGIGKSEIGELPTHGLQAAKDLLSMLEYLDVPAPYILVGHSYGGDVVRLFASMYPDRMAGLILEDTQHEDILSEQRKILKGKDLENLEQMVARFGTPDNPRTELDYRNITREQVKNSNPLPRIPFVVLSAGDRSQAMPPMFSEKAKEELITLGGQLQQRLVALIPGGDHIVVEGAGHNIHVEKPEALIEPTVKMLKALRK